MFFCQMGPLLTQVLGDDRYQKPGRRGWKLQPRDSGREPKGLVGARPKVSLLQLQPKHQAGLEDT